MAKGKMKVGTIKERYRRRPVPEDGVMKTLRRRKLRNYTWIGVGLAAYWVFWFLMLASQVEYNQMHPVSKQALDSNGIVIKQAQ
jgi:hypothetical protein